ncbi:16S rRNA (guanine(527)-N(7))-methyltransferase RsmG [Phocaeicola abscessus]|uniref:16S rRNA (guanine(527)-N(7))-methyltransferase RsmG n=1 Tax=Phocaeicola abscessus TaxID=555313 RepID=UPI000386C74E|nr:16S rRNA (guanine(527)-N(7))-methyltransferase RsmG [Phocaeicola abscessus]EPT34348.1 16S rRNA (guanine(527)-N(7))-methyltransferase RsmG [Bacteroidetes bacterium oral taxon 272 str. F0290]
MELILKYFPDLTSDQQRQFAALDALYSDWNSKINVISRKDIAHLYEHHVLHSLAIPKFIRFRAGTSVLDFGTGGGFPGIPLAIYYPDVRFHLIDSTGKKVGVAGEVARAIGLKNVTVSHRRAEDEIGKYDFVVSRAVMPIADMLKIIRKNIVKTNKNAFPNGLICLKGGDLNEEIRTIKHLSSVYELKKIFEETYFETKKLVHVIIKV